MGTINIKCERKEVEEKGEASVYPKWYSGAELKKFKPEILGLGNIGERARRIDVIAGVFDLSGFTDFCCQVDPHLSMPLFLKEFLDWLFEVIKTEFEEKRVDKGSVFYSELPFFAKFTGDGVLFLWDTKDMDMNLICNIIVMLRNITAAYSTDFVLKMKKRLSHIPRSLRCGMACGTVCSVGNGEDYVGPCINIATRLQKLSSLEFCISKRGVDFEAGMLKEVAERYIVKSVTLRGIGEDELVIVRKSEFEELSAEEKKLFEDV